MRTYTPALLTLRLGLGLGLLCLIQPTFGHGNGNGELVGSGSGEFDEERLPLPSYHFGAGIMVECMERDVNYEGNMEDYTGRTIANEPATTITNTNYMCCKLWMRLGGTWEKSYYDLQVFREHVQLDDNSLKYIPFPICNETGKPLELKYGVEEGVIDSGVAYSTSPLSHITGPAALTKKLIIGDELPLRLSVRWFPTPLLPRENGKVEWNGLGGHVGWVTIGYIILAFGAGATVMGAWMVGWEVPRRMKGWSGRLARAGGLSGGVGKSLGGATPLGYGIKGNGNGNAYVNGGTVGNGWGFVGGGVVGRDGKRD
ncbi:hypothetical protein SS1G_14457 [Sclerotinia sclerotiorum 1980 UF-70]|uniref:Uncharacterized protein n=1 Tax=Sclerotinia sclerotiorum (strain ATCC 18683 / 1980 / Ss-1) TaxID=665079 RepID=A7FA26_SCLS1|nr:hypothetical protein SS1G_14457 [Sclerotinia sclerotiorum 1980 UF-70]EDO00587.1 hypothetical protein SS1G_14457 [Sclerotinia sclerotiorum 1980 UF-70]